MPFTRSWHSSMRPLPTIVSRGGRVLKHYYDALNGMKVEIARSEVEGLQNIPGVVQVVRRRALQGQKCDQRAVHRRAPGLAGHAGICGEHVKIAMIDTGIDYTHADFGGPGTVAAYAKALAGDTAPADPSLYGPAAPKVKGGTDLVGDAYNADDPKNNTPVPDPNPLDCGTHGTHTAGTAAGFGVAMDGTTYRGPYDQAAYANGFMVGPGVAPLADLYAVKVFGCTGSTEVVTEAIDWAVHNDMDVISMSLGSDYGNALTADALASDAASKAGIVVVAAAGNAGPGLYLTGTPSTGTRAISVAAIDAHVFLPGGVILTLSGGVSAGGIDETTSRRHRDRIPLPSSSATARWARLQCERLRRRAQWRDCRARTRNMHVPNEDGQCDGGRCLCGGRGEQHSRLHIAGNHRVTIPFVSLLQSDGPKFVSAAAGETATLVTGNVRTRDIAWPPPSPQAVPGWTTAR